MNFPSLTCAGDLLKFIASFALFIPVFTCAQKDTVIVDRSQPYVVFAKSDDNLLGLEDEVTVYVMNWMQTWEKNRTLIKTLVLYIDDMPVEGIIPVSYAVDSSTLALTFFITHEEGPVAVWEKMLLTRNTGEFFSRQVKISIGYKDQPSLQTKLKEKNGYTVILVEKTWFYLCIFVLAVLFLLFAVVAVKTDLIRDNSPAPPPGKRRPYSLARTQMALWFFVLMSSWLLLYVLKHTLNTIPDEMVVLMGISAGTGIGALSLDNRNKNAIRVSCGFFRDVISDENGVSFHRFQMAAWTIVMVMVFIRQVAFYLQMPVFDTSLLVLMGITSGTYLGFKASEKPKDETKELGLEDSVKHPD